MTDRMEMFVHNGRIFVQSPWALKATMQALPGGYPKKVDGTWYWTYPASPAAARAIIDTLGDHRLDPDDHVEQLYAEAVREDDALHHKDATDADLPEIPGRMPAWLHQKRAYHFAYNRRGTMLAMDMGTGKSRTAISLLDGWDSRCVVILCPRSVVAVWANQFALHSEHEWQVIVPPGHLTIQKRAAHIEAQFLHATMLKKRVAIVVNYEAAWREPMKTTLLHIALAREQPAEVILDESHRIKSPGGKASKYCELLCRKVRHVLELTGTPMPHSPLDVFAQYRCIDPGIYGTNFHRFRSMYAIMGGWEGKQVVGYQNQPRFAQLFGSASFVVRKDEAGLDLPPVVHTYRTFEMGDKSKRAYRTIDEGFILAVEDGTVTVANALVELLRLQQITSGYVKDDEGVEHQVGDDKLRELADVMEDVAPPVWADKPFQSRLEKPGEPLVIFARFKHDIGLIAGLCREQGRRVGIVDGDHHQGHQDYGLNQHSQMRDDIDVCVLQLQSGGVGIDLTRACLAIYYSLDFSLGNYDQTLARLDRPGQTRSVTYIHLIADRTKDEVVYEALQERRDVVEAVIAASRRRKDQAA